MLGYDYPASPVVVPDGGPVPAPQLTAYRPSAHAGARLPHAWLPDGRSLYDLLGDGFSLLRLDPVADPGPLLRAAAQRSVPVMDVVTSSSSRPVVRCRGQPASAARAGRGRSSTRRLG